MNDENDRTGVHWVHRFFRYDRCVNVMLDPHMPEVHHPKRKMPNRVHHRKKVD